MKIYVFIVMVMLFLGCPEVVVLEQLVPVQAPTSVEIDGNAYDLTYVDNFDDYDKFAEDWDVGNPGYEKTAVGNLGYDMPEEVAFADGLKGYKNDRYKQVFWSPKAVNLDNGFLEIWALWDPTVPVYNKDGKLIQRGYAISGAVHSRRQFPYGYFEARLIFDRNTRTHWDAFWFETNSPFSRAYGTKKLFTPTAAMLPSGITMDDVAKQNTVKYEYKEANRAPEKSRGFNGQQVYEYDVFEWLDSGVYLATSQWNVLHSFDWYGGYPGIEHVKETGIDKDANGPIHDMKTIDELRGPDYRDGGVLNFHESQPMDKEYFTLGMLWTKDKLIMYFDGEERLNYKAPSGGGHFDNPALNGFFTDDRFNPIQAKFSTEFGSWNTDHQLFIDLFQPDGVKVVPDPDVMYVDYFAFYAENPDKATWYGGRTDFAVSN